MLLYLKCKKEGRKLKIQLKAARVNANLTQKQVAEKLKISKNTIISYELYRAEPSIATAQKLADIYGLSVDDIIWT